jgi:Zn-dependent metalloprotease
MVKPMLAVSFLSAISLSAQAQLDYEQLAITEMKARTQSVLSFESVNTQKLNDRMVVRLRAKHQGIAVDGADVAVAFSLNDAQVMYVENKIPSELILISEAESKLGQKAHFSATSGDVRDLQKDENLRNIKLSSRFRATLSEALIQSNIEVAEIGREALALVLKEELRKSIQENTAELQFKKVEINYEWASENQLRKVLVGEILTLGAKSWPVKVKVNLESRGYGQVLSVLRLGHGLGEVVIYDGAFNPAIPLKGKGVKQLINGERVGGRFKKLFITDQAREASENLVLVRNYYQNQFARNSYDGKGAIIEAIVRVGAISFVDLFGLRQNAAWVGALKLFIFGKGENDGIKNLTQATDVIGHEYTHAVVDTSAGLVYEGQSGALNEHFADFFGELIQQRTGRGVASSQFLIGETVLSDQLIGKASAKRGRPVRAIRDMRHPGEGLMPQPATISQISKDFDHTCRPSSKNDNCGVHINSGVPNYMSALIVERLGWEKSQVIFYNTLVGRLTSRSNFYHFAEALKKECWLKLTTEDCLIVEQATIAVGL